MSLYLYGITRTSNSTDPGTGLEDRPVYHTKDGLLAALVTELPAERVRASRRNLMAHAGVLERAFMSGTVLPVRFGTLIPDEKTLRGEVLTPRTDTYLALLDQFEGFVELGLRAIWDEQAIFDEIRSDQDVVTLAQARLASRAAGATYQAQIQLGQKVEQALLNRNESAANHILDRLRPFATEVKDGKHLLDRMVINSTFLMHRDDVPAFEAAVEHVDREYQDRLQFRLTTPTIPYHFIELHT